MKKILNFFLVAILVFAGVFGVRFEKIVEAVGDGVITISGNITVNDARHVVRHPDVSRTYQWKGSGTMNMTITGEEVSGYAEISARAYWLCPTHDRGEEVEVCGGDGDALYPVGSWVPASLVDTLQSGAITGTYYPSSRKIEAAIGQHAFTGTIKDGTASGRFYWELPNGEPAFYWSGSAVGEIEVPKKAVIAGIRGEAEVDFGGKGVWVPLTPDMELGEGDYLSTDFDSEVDLTMPCGSKVVIRELTEFRLNRLFDSDSLRETEIQLRIGSLRSLVDRDDRVLINFEVVTPTAVVAVRGTIFSVKYDDKTEITEVFVERGEVLVTDKDGKGEIVVRENEYVAVAMGESPPEPILESEIEEEDIWWEKEEKSFPFIPILIPVVILIVAIGAFFIVKKRKK